MIDFETWWNSSSADEFRRLNDDMDGRVVRPVWDAAIRATLSSQKATSAAPSPEAAQPTQAEAPVTTVAAYQRAKEADIDRMLSQLIEERDERQQVLDDVLDLVLGQDRAEWSSAYGFRDAVNDVGERMAALATQQAEPEVERTPLSISRMACLIDEEARYAYQEIQRLVKTINYMVGIAERGRGVKCPPEEFPEKFLLDYIKELESTQQGDPEETDPVKLDLMADPVRRAAFEAYHNTQSGHYDRMNAAVAAVLATQQAERVLGSTAEELHTAIEGAHDLSGPLHERIRKLVELRAQQAGQANEPSAVIFNRVKDGETTKLANITEYGKTLPNGTHLVPVGQQHAVQAEPAAWQDPETLDVIASGRKADWMTNHGHGGRKKAVSYTTPLYATPPDPGRVARHDKTCASLLDGGAAGPCDCSAPGQVDRDREDAENWRWLTEDCDGDAQDDFIRWLSGNVASKADIDARVKAIRAARSSEGGGNEHSR